jgi:glycosyltransferase involved in cell wall biosynthesis
VTLLPDLASEDRTPLLYVGTLPPHPGGTAISGFQLLLGLLRLGHPIRSLAPVTEETRERAIRFDARYPALHVRRYLVPHYDFGAPVPPPPGYRDAERSALGVHLPRLLDEDRPGVVIAGRESYVWDVPEIAHRRGVPVVQLIRGGTQTCALLDGRYPPGPAHELLTKFRGPRRLVSVSRHLAEGFVRLGLSSIETIANFVDTDAFAPRPKDVALLEGLRIPPDGIVTMFVGNLKARKRPLDVVAAAVIAAPRDPRLTYVVVGDGSFRDAMQAECRRHGLADRFRFVGWVEYETVPAYFNVADIVVMPSEAEGLSRVYLEAQASGAVLVASDIPAAREVVDDGKTGLLFRLGVAEDLAEKIMLAARDAELRGKISAAGRQRVRVNSLDAVSRQYSQLFREVAADHLRVALAPGCEG